MSICEEKCGSVEKCCVGGVGKRGKIKKGLHGRRRSFFCTKSRCCCRSAVLKTRSYNQCLLAISVDSLAEVKHGGVVALKWFSISNYKHR